MQAFTDWTGKTPNELLTEAEAEIRKGLLLRQRSVKRYLIGFRKHLQDQGLAPMSVKSHVARMQSFYKCFDIDVPKLPRSGNRAQPLEKHKDIPTKEDLQDALKVCDPLEKAILLVGVSSGLSANEIIRLKVKDFKEGYDSKTEITTLILRRGKVGTDFVTFLSPEASRAVQDYLEFRARTIKTTDKKRQNQIEKQRVLVDTNYLFIGRQIPNQFLETKNDELRRLKELSFFKIYRTISEKAQKNTPKGDWNLLRSHNVRKYFNSTLLNSGADFFFTEFLMGHTLNDTKAAYFRASPKQLREIYLKFVPYLTIQKEADISESPEYLRIKQENQILQAETVRNIVERRELQELRKELEAEKAGKAALKSEIMKELLDAFKLNEENKIEFTRDFDDEQIDELARLGAEYSEYRPRESGVRDLGVPPEYIPEKEEDIIKRILKPDSKASEKKS
ncbi:tyrosine-type recombinase/integrase [Methanosarcina sp. UBA5]|uniref:tyrosine-type recombinase/integrase n=1 Tax=Methanosarcina sp. UBA5 TaxID=1915593 RepID=UPI003BEF436F